LGKPGQGEQEHGALADQAGFLDPAKLDQAAAAAGIGDGRKGGMGLLD
jgi:starvation-inducible outer membrane lipoprotein